MRMILVKDNASDDNNHDEYDAADDAEYDGSIDDDADENTDDAD